MNPRAFTFAVLCCGLLVSPAAAQDITSQQAAPQIPFDEWIAEAQRADLPCKIEISPPRLSLLQRPVVEFRVKVPAKTLAGLGPAYQLYLDVRLRKAGAGAWLDVHDITGAQLQGRLPKGDYLQFSVRALILPGEYTAGFILFDQLSGKRSVKLRKLKVAPLASDPLPEISRDLPEVEFFQRGVDGETEALPELNSRLRLPVATRRAVRVELLVNFAAPEQVAGRRSLHQKNVAAMLGILKVLSQMEIANGTLHITALDLLRRTILFEQQDVHTLDWTRLRAALAQLNPLAIPVQALEGRRNNAAFLRDILEDRLRPAAAHGDAGTNGGNHKPGEAEPLRVVIVVSSPTLFVRGADLDPVLPPRGADFRVFHLQYRFNPALLWDEVPRVLRELHARRFEMQSPEEFRRALARIVADLRQL